MDKIYTAQEMRKAAERFAFEEGSSRSKTIVAMLRQAADLMEREEKRNKEYEYAEKDVEDGYVYDRHTETYEYIRDLQSEHGNRNGTDTIIVRRPVGEWEEVKV